MKCKWQLRNEEGKLLKEGEQEIESDLRGHLEATLVNFDDHTRLKLDWIIHDHLPN